MNRKKLLISSAIISASILSTLSITAEAKVKCHGICKAGENGCGTELHQCAGQSINDYDPNDWKYTDEEECLNLKKNLNK